MRPIRVLYAIGSLDRGGTECQLVELLGRLDRRRFQPAVVCLEAAGALAGSVRDLGVPVYVCGYQGFRIKRDPVRTLAALARLRRAITSFRPDVVHGMLFWGYVLGTLAARSAGVAAVVAARRSLGHHRSAHSPRVRAIEAAANRRVDLFVANSEAVREDAIRGEGLPPEKVRVLYNGVDLSRFRAIPKDEARARLGISPDVTLVVVVANLIHYKGHHVLLEALRTIDPGCRRPLVVLIGDGSERDALLARSRQLGLDSTVRFAGSTPEVPRWLSAADLLVHPSLEEGFPNAVLEAMAVGRAVVATTAGGTPEAVVDGVTGWLVPPGDPAALASAIVTAIGAPERLLAAGEAAQRRILDRFTIERSVEAHEALYNELAAKRA